MHVAVIILNWNGKQDTLECLASLENLQDVNYSVIVTDNGSTDNSIEAISSHYPHITILNNKENLGFAEGNNRAITYALQKKFDALFLLNNDTIVSSTILKEFLSLSRLYPKTIFGAKVYLHSKQDTFDHLGGIWNKKKGEFDLVACRKIDDHLSWESPMTLDYVCGCSLFAAADVFREVGLLDPRFFLFWEESDFCLRAKKLGYEIRLCPKAILWHKVSASFVGGKPHTTYFFWRNRFLWIEKNLPFSELCSLYLRRLIPQSFKVYKHYCIKSLEYRLLSLINSKKCKGKKEKLLTLRASCHGIRDYLLRRFYNGPSWIYKGK